MVDTIHHRGRLVEKVDLVDVLDFARAKHHLLAVDDIEACLLQRIEHRGFRIVDADRHVCHSGLFDQARNLVRVAPHQAETRRDGTAHADHAS